MKLESTKAFPFSMETAWAALHKPAMLDVEVGSEVRVISDTTWEAHNKDSGTVTAYSASFDEENKVLIIDGVSSVDGHHDHMYLTLTELAPDRVSLEIVIEINTGLHLIAKALGALLAKPMQSIITKHIYHNFEALCTGQETRRMSKAELDDIAKKTFERKHGQEEP